jgi:hypothetical protein
MTTEERDDELLRILDALRTAHPDRQGRLLAFLAMAPVARFLLPNQTPDRLLDELDRLDRGLEALRLDPEATKEMQPAPGPSLLPVFSDRGSFVGWKREHVLVDVAGTSRAVFPRVRAWLSRPR